MQRRRDSVIRNNTDSQLFRFFFYSKIFSIIRPFNVVTWWIVGKSTFAQNCCVADRRKLAGIARKRIKNNYASCDSGGGFVIRFYPGARAAVSVTNPWETRRTYAQTAAVSSRPFQAKSDGPPIVFPPLFDLGCTERRPRDTLGAAAISFDLIHTRRQRPSGSRNTESPRQASVRDFRRFEYLHFIPFVRGTYNALLSRRNRKRVHCTLHVLSKTRTTSPVYEV